MPIAVALTAALVATSAFLHYEVLSVCNLALPHATWLHARIKVLVAVAAAMTSHVLQVALFGAAYYFLQNVELLGGLAGQLHDSYETYLYFSLETYTSL